MIAVNDGRYPVFLLLGQVLQQRHWWGTSVDSPAARAACCIASPAKSMGGASDWDAASLRLTVLDWLGGADLTERRGQATLTASALRRSTFAGATQRSCRRSQPSHQVHHPHPVHRHRFHP